MLAVFLLLEPIPGLLALKPKIRHVGMACRTLLRTCMLCVAKQLLDCDKQSKAYLAVAESAGAYAGRQHKAV